MASAAPTRRPGSDQWRITSVGPWQESDRARCRDVQDNDRDRAHRHPGDRRRSPTTSCLELGLRAQRHHFGSPVNVARPSTRTGDLCLEKRRRSARRSRQRFRARAPEQGRGRHDLVPGEPAEQGRPRPRSADPATNLGEIYVRHNCESKHDADSASACGWGDDRRRLGRHHGTVIPPLYITVPELTCCFAHHLGGSRGRHPELTATHERHGLLVPQRLARAELALRQTSSGAFPRFDTASGTPTGRSTRARLAGRRRSTSRERPTPARRAGELSYNASTNKLTINGIDLHRRERDQHGQRRDVRRPGRADPHRARSAWTTTTSFA